jgi:hypothetical protein
MSTGKKSKKKTKKKCVKKEQKKCSKSLKKPKKKTRRSQNKYPGLDPSLNLKTRYELIDMDYVNKLSEKEKMWLNNFMEEYVNGNFNHEGKRIHKKKNKNAVVKKTGKKRVIDVYKQEAEKRNNDRNNDVLTRAKAYGGAFSIEGQFDEASAGNEEDALIEALDLSMEKFDEVDGSDDEGSDGTESGNDTE